MSFLPYMVLAVVTILLVPAVHAARRRTSLVYTYGVLAVMAFAGWVTPHGIATSVGDLSFGLASSVFYGAVLGGVFLLYVVDGPRAARMGVALVMGVGVLYALLAVLLQVLAPAADGGLLHLDSPRAAAASLLASLVALCLLGIAWEGSRRPLSRLWLCARVFVVLLVVLEGDTLVYFPLAWWGRPAFGRTFEGALVSRLVLAALYAPVFTAYLWYEVKRYGLKLTAHPVLSIVTREDLERELLSARHSLRLGTEALWMSEEQYRRMVEDIPLFVCRFSRDGTVTYANRSLCTQRHLPLDAVLGKPVLAAIVPEERDRAWSDVLALTPSAPIVELTLRTDAPPGSSRVERWVVRGVFTPSGASVAYQAIGVDVTRETELEAAARNASRMEGIARLAGGVAHDFSNLVSVIAASASTAREALGNGARGVSPIASEAVDDIGRAAERAMSLTRQLKAISRQEQVSLQRVDLSQVVLELAPLVRRLLPESVRLELDCAPHLPAALLDPTQLERVVVNLVVNARDAMPDGGLLRVSTAGVAVDGEALRLHPGARAGRYVVLTVNDSGHGMDEAVMRQIFEPFFTTRAAAGGTGLGLATVQGIAQQAGGFVRVDSAPGAGASFQVHFPVADDDGIVA